MCIYAVKHYLKPTLSDIICVPLHMKSIIMKIKLSIIAALLLCLVSCNSSDSPEKFAEQAMETISRGDDKSLSLSNALVFDEIAKAVLDSVDCPDNPVDKYFQIGEPFFRWELIGIKEEKMNLLTLKDLTIGESGENGKYEGVMYRTYIDLYGKEGGEHNNSKLVKINNRMAVILEYDIPLYKMRYKIDEHHEAFVGNKYRIATLGVIKHPEHGYKVVSFMWE